MPTLVTSPGIIHYETYGRGRPVLLLHGCCHNPTGVDLDASQWQAIVEVVRARKLLPLIDFAYQGFATGLREDAEGVNIVAAGVPELLVASSYSKNFGLYSERVGALTLVAGSTDAAQAALSHIKTVIRSNYSNPPQHGAAIVARVLADPALTATPLAVPMVVAPCLTVKVTVPSFTVPAPLATFATRVAVASP